MKEVDTTVVAPTIDEIGLSVGDDLYVHGYSCRVVNLNTAKKRLTLTPLVRQQKAEENEQEIESQGIREETSSEAEQESSPADSVPEVCGDGLEHEVQKVLEQEG